MTEPFAIIGDIHGEAGRLSALIQEIGSRRLIFVGDYVNRGPETRKTLDQLVDLRDKDHETIFLLGNHEDALLAFLENRLPFHEFAGLGGIATIRAYLTRASGDVRAEFRQAFPDSHRRFLEHCGEFYETSDLLVSHSGVDPTNFMSRVKADMVMKHHKGLFSETFNPPKLVVCGHYSQSSGSPHVRNNFVCLDTGCGTTGGPLTALLMPERTFLQQ
jgi:serine/threonine protein phosphatase 1